MLVAGVVVVVLAEQRVAERDHRRQKVVQPVTGGQREARRIAFGHPPHVHPGEAVGLLFGHQRRRALLVELGLLLDRVAVFVGQHHRDGHVAVGLPQRGQQDTTIPADGVVVLAEAGVDQAVGRLVAERAAVVVGVPRDQFLDRLELAVEGLSVGVLPEGLQVADRLRGDLVVLAAVAVGDLARGLLGIRAQPAGAVDGLQTGHLERVVEDRHGFALHGRAAAGKHHRGTCHGEQTPQVSCDA